MMAAESGKPMAPPTPKVAETVAMAEGRRSLSTRSRSMAMPSGTMPEPKPLQGASDDHDRHIRCQRANQAAKDQGNGQREQYAPLAEHVA